MFLLIWIVYLGSVNSLTESSSRLCFLYGELKHVFCQNESSNLACSDNQLIRIMEIEIEMKISGPMNGCSRCPPNTGPGVWENVTDIVYVEALLYNACSRKNKCNFIAGDTGNVRNIWTANVMYECVENDLFKDICLPWIQETNSVHIFLERTGNATNNCSCTIKGDRETTSIEVVDYRPYGNDFRCVGSSFIVDDKEMFHCEENGTNVGMGSSVFNEIRTVNSNVTKVEVLLPGDVPEMIWIHVKGINMTVQCNTYDSSSTFPSSFLPSPPSTSISTVVTISNDTVPEINTTKETTDTESDTVTTFPLQPNKGNEDRTIFSLPVIAGGSAGLLFLVVCIAVIICFLCRRKSTQTSKAKEKENMYEQYNAQSNTTNISPIKSGVINQGNETENKMIHIVLNDFSNSNYEEVGRKYEEADDGDYDGTEYAESADVVADDINAETFGIESAGIQMSQKSQNNVECHNYTEPYYKALTNGNEIQKSYDKVIKRGQKKDAYDMCIGIENYSHILTGMIKQAPQTKDNYSHIHIDGNKQDSSCLGNYSHTKVRQREGIEDHERSDMYTHIQNEPPKQQVLLYKETKSEEGEYDHLNKFPHP